jgi:SAM domain (Sterile alpha motif)
MSHSSVGFRLTRSCVWTPRLRKTIIGCKRFKETTMDVAVWLRGLGLQQYEALFRENDVDAEVLSDLTDGDLEKIGVSLGHRKRLLKAVAALAGSRGRASSRRHAHPAGR